MLDQVQTNKLLFIDIETCGCYATLDEVEEKNITLFNLWNKMGDSYFRRHYSEDERIIISGSIKNYDSSHHNTVSIFVTDSLGETEFFKMLEPDSTGQFSITVPAAIQFEDDLYTVSALYMPLLLDYEGFYTYGEEQKITTSFEIVGDDVGKFEP